MVSIQQLVAHCDERLSSGDFDDYCPNGLQVEAGERVSVLVSGVTASMALIEQAIALKADALLVHHGYFWRGEAQPLVGVKGRRVAALMRHGISLMAYHLPLDAHPELGNNRCFGDRLGVLDGRPTEAGRGLVWAGALPGALSAEALSERLQRVCERRPLHLSGGPQRIERLAWCTGAAEGYIEQAAALGVDAYVSGEVSESTLHLARELGVHYYAVGHHASERFGVQVLADELAQRFGLTHHFVDLPNPV